MQHKFFMADQPANFWKLIQSKKANGGEVPYKPNPLRYRYLLQNEYEEVSNIEKPSE